MDRSIDSNNILAQHEHELLDTNFTCSRGMESNDRQVEQHRSDNFRECETS